MSPPIAILGAGPAGLTLARLLEVKKIDYIVFDRDQSASDENQGGSLDLHAESGQAALKLGGLFDEFKKHARYESVSTKLGDKDGRIAMDISQSGDVDRPEIDRKTLRKILIDAIPTSKLRWGCRAREVKRDDDGTVSIHFENGRTASGFRLVVGADGLWSKVRGLITSAQPKYSGHTTLASTISHNNPVYSAVEASTGEGTYMSISAQKTIVTQRNADGTYKIYITLQLPEDWRAIQGAHSNTETIRKWLIEERFTGWSTELVNVIKHAEGVFHTWPLYSMAQEDFRWQSVPGVTVIGDAAHITVPNGDGVNIAMTDAMQLSERIEKRGIDDVDEAVAEYEKEMFPRAKQHIEAGDMSINLLYAADGPDAFPKAHGVGDDEPAEA